MTPGPALIGLVEWSVLRWRFGLLGRWSALWMVIGNYASIWVLFFATPVLRLEQRLDIHNVATVLATALVVAYLLAIVIEWPFCRLTLGWARHSWSRSGRASVLAQSASFAVLIPFYAVLGTLSVLRVHKDRGLASAIPAGVVTFYLGPEGRVFRQRFGGHGVRQTLSLPGAAFAELALVPDSGLGAGWTLWACPRRGGAVMIVEHVRADRATAVELLTQPAGLRCRGGFGVADLSGGHGDFDVRALPDGPEGLHITERATGRQYSVGFEVPFSHRLWPVTNVTLLPGNVALYQFGNQIVVLDLARRTMGLIARGSHPVVLIE